MCKTSSRFWKSAELPTACDKHNCTVTNNVATYNKLLAGNISNTFAAVDIPYWFAANIVVTTDNVQVAKNQKQKKRKSIEMKSSKSVRWKLWNDTPSNHLCGLNTC